MPSRVLSLIGWRIPGAYLKLALNLRSMGASWEEEEGRGGGEGKRERDDRKKRQRQVGRVKKASLRDY